MERKPIIGIYSSVIADESGSFAGYKMHGIYLESSYGEKNQSERTALTNGLKEFARSLSSFRLSMRR